MENKTIENFTGYNTEYLDRKVYDPFSLFLYHFDWVIIPIGFLLILAAIVSHYYMIQKDHVAPIYIINLLVSDIIQLCFLAAKNTQPYAVLHEFYFYGLFTSVGFMVCIAMERYLIIAWPLWYRFRRNIKTSLLVCAAVWILPLLYFVPRSYSLLATKTSRLLAAVVLLLPFPLLVFLLVGTIRALSAARSVPADGKRRIVAILVTVLLIYTQIFLPYIILVILFVKSEVNEYFHRTVIILLKISPLADLIMYFLIRKGSSDKLLAALCCGKTCWNQETSSQNTEMSASCSQNI